jgi:hypothetical protein
MARRFRAEATMNWQWMAGAWHLGGWSCVSNLPGQKGRKSVNGENPFSAQRLPLLAPWK